MEYKDMNFKHVELENGDMVEGAIRLLKALEQNGVLSVVQAGMVRLDIMYSMNDILDEMDKKMNRLMR